MSQYGPAMTYAIVLLTLGIVGITYMMLIPLVDVLLNIGFANVGCDPFTMAVLRDAFYIWIPIAIVFSAIVYAWRKSNQTRIA